MLARISRGGLLGHVLEGLGEALLAEGQLAGGPDLGVLECSWSARHFSKYLSYTNITTFSGTKTDTGQEMDKGKLRTGFRFFFCSQSSVPALMAMISGAASGSCAMGEPHSVQKTRWTVLPEEPVSA